jgi:hypothetical protein
MLENMNKKWLGVAVMSVVTFIYSAVAVGAAWSTFSISKWLVRCTSLFLSFSLNFIVAL